MDEKTLEALDEADLIRVLRGLDAYSSKSTDKVATDDELHAWIVDKVGINVPRTAVCPSHRAPFDFVSDIVLGRVDGAIVVGNRGGGKTFLSALIIFCLMYFNKEQECISVGAQEVQARRAYAHFKTFQKKAAAELVEESLISRTSWRDAQVYEILTGSKGSVNGPHAPFVHRDEVELMDKIVYNESLQIEKSKQTEDGRIIPAQTLITSTRKTSDGLMQELLDQCTEAVREGRKPPYEVYFFCARDIVQNQAATCRITNPGLPEEEKCECHLIQKGEWSEGKPRTFDEVCRGDFAKADGFTPIEDLQKTFSKSSKAMWEAQQECKRPYAEDITIESFSVERHGIKGFDPDPDNGPLYMGVDVGGTSPHAVEFGQLLFYEVEAQDFEGKAKRIPEGSIVLFDEIYIAEIGNSELADLIIDTERRYRMYYPKFRIRGRFVDPQAKITRLDFRRHDPPLNCSWPAITRDREEHTKRIRTRVDNDTFYVSLDKCEMFVEELLSWNIDVKKFDHAVDAGFYLVSNVHNLLEKGKVAATGDLPVSKPSSVTSISLPGANPFQSQPGQEIPKEEEWRFNLINID
jgi:hypothetical protein